VTGKLFLPAFLGKKNPFENENCRISFTFNNNTSFIEEIVTFRKPDKFRIPEQCQLRIPLPVPWQDPD
jgi:hypothetical protein